MNATTTTQQKKIGDRVKVTGGQSKGQTGTLIAKQQRAWTVELEDGTQVNVAFPMVTLIEVTEVATTGDPNEEGSETISTEADAEPATDETANDAQAEETAVPPAGDETVSEPPDETRIEEADNNAITPEGDTPDPEESGSSEDAAIGETNSVGIDPEIAKLTVRQLWDLAKQRGVSVARTKSDFFRIIKAMNPDEDLAALKGQKLFDRVKELHISRLRSKAEMAKLLSA